MNARLRAVRLALVMVGSAAQGGLVRAQDPPVVTDTLPFCSCKAVASEGGQGNPPLEEMFAGAGGGLFALQTTSETAGSAFNPKLWTPNVNNTIRTDGFVYDIRTTEDRVVIANGRGGVIAYDRNSTTKHEVEFVMPPEAGEDVRAIDFLQGVQLFSASADIVIYGTNDLDQGGFVRIYSVADEAVIAEIDVGNAVNSIETTFEATSGMLTVLVGLWGQSKE